MSLETKKRRQNLLGASHKASKNAHWAALQVSAVTISLTFLAMGCLVDQSKRDGAQVQVFNSQSSAGNLQGSAADRLAGFQATVYPYVTNNCRSCHGTTQSPKFAQSDASAAMDIVLSFPLVSFSDVSSSTIVHKVSDGHCGSQCSGDSNAQTMIDLINAWKAAFSSTGPGSLPGETTTAVVYTDALPVPAPNPAGCKLPEDLSCSPDIKVDRVDAKGNKLCANKCWSKLRYPVAKFSVLPGTPDSQNPMKDASLQRAWLEVDFAYENYASNLGVAAYVLKNPRIMSPDGPVYVHDLGLYLNGQYKSNYGQAYHNIDMVVDKANFNVTDSSGKKLCNLPPFPTPVDFSTLDALSTSYCVPSVAPLFSTAASAADIFQERTAPTNPDTIAFSFGYMQSGKLGNCKEPNVWLNQVYKPIVRGSIDCLDCHKPAGAVTEAGQRFDMYAANYVTGATDADPSKAAAYIAKNFSDLDSTTQAQLQTVCQRFLQRSNLQNPSLSPIIVQPVQGLNGMPPRANFQLYNSDKWWIGWIKAEALDLGIGSAN